MHTYDHAYMHACLFVRRHQHVYIYMRTYVCAYMYECLFGFGLKREMMYDTIQLYVNKKSTNDYAYVYV